MKKELLGLLFITLSSCSYEHIRNQNDSSVASGSTDFEWLQTNLFRADCTGCHGETAKINLTSYDSIISNSRIFNANNPASSLLLEVIQNGRMPPKGGLSNGESVTVLSCWLSGGASKEDTACSVGAQNSNPSGDQTGESANNRPSRNPKPDPTTPSEPNPRPTDPVDNPADAIGYDSVFQMVFEPHCVSCHSEDLPSAGIALDSYAAIIAKAKLIDPKKSLLVEVLESGYMPFGDTLTEEQIQLVSNWIKEGAKK